jgi:hypothetical protein
VPSDIEAVAVRLRALSDRARDEGGPKAAEAMGRVLLYGIQTNELRRFSHAAGTPTPSPRGAPPARISGDLARSMRQEPASGARKVGKYEFQVMVGPTIVYGRIQELGGETGKNHATTIPARPYIAPATLRLRGQIHDAGVRAFVKAIGA